MTPPSGTVTFLFTDIEGSTRLWEQHPQAMRDALARHDVLMHLAIASNGGVVFKTIGDAFCAAFATAPQALIAAFNAQQSLQRETWPDPLIISVRMALHTGTADERDGDYFGPPLNRVARLLSTGHGGQTLLSQPTYDLTRDSLPSGCTLLDLGPHSLRDLARPEQVYQLCHPDLSSQFPPLKSLDSLPNNLPQQMTSFIGREKELAQVKDLLTKTKLLTLTGSGGCGKTRLSLQTAADVLDTFPDGVWLVELAPITDPSLVPQTVSSVLGVKEQAGKTLTQVLTESLKSKTLLLVLDNCEHLLAASAALVADLLRTCPSIKLLASSRESLNVAGEQTYRVPSLSLPDSKQTATPKSLSQYEAVRLFIDRAMLVKPDFAVTNQNAPALASVCHRVDGIPLALELAAARMRSLSVEEINGRLDNRFRLLTGGARTSLPRQQTLRALIDWSYDLLMEQEKSLFIRLSAFAGGWTLSAGEAVCVGDDIEDWEVLDLLTSLVDKSLVNVDQADSQTRYRLLETVRQYSRDRLAESDLCLLVRGRHRDYFLTLAEETAPKLNGPKQAHWLSVLETEHDNLRQALAFCLEQSEAEDPDAAEKGLRLGIGLQKFWWTQGHLSEGRERLMALLSHSGAQTHTDVLANALNSAGHLAWMQGDYAMARSLYAESLRIYRELGNKFGIANSLGNLGNVAQTQGNHAVARSQYEESLTLSRELGDKSGIAYSLLNLGYVAYEIGDYAVTRSLNEECMALFRELGNKSGIAYTLLNLGSVAQRQGNHAVARSQYEETLALSRELGDKSGIAYSLLKLGNVASEIGDYAMALPLLQESCALHREMGNREGIAGCLEYFAALAVKEEKAERAAHLFGAAAALRETIDAPLMPTDREEYDRDVMMAREMLGDEAFAAAWAEGQAMTWEQAVEYALGEESASSSPNK